MKSKTKEKVEKKETTKTRAKDSHDYDTMLLAYIEKEFMNDKK